jgi:L-ascorbate metabolism protein UlaG (beta-lactamase superfamily)
MPGLITWIGHATVHIELDGVRVLTDPLLRGGLGHLKRHGPPPDPALLRDLDAVLISHLHFDHLDLPSLRRLSRDVRILVPRGAGSFLHRQGFPHAEELDVGDVAHVRGLAIAAVPAVHDGRRRPSYAGGPSADTIGFMLGARVYFAGDTDLFDEMAGLAGTDVALIPVWGWGPSLGEGHLDPPAAASATALVRPRIAVPIHWGTFYPRGLARYKGHRLTDPPHEFAAAVAELAPDVEVRVLAPGGALALPG